MPTSTHGRRQWRTVQALFAACAIIFSSSCGSGSGVNLPGSSFSVQSATVPMGVSNPAGMVNATTAGQTMVQIMVGPGANGSENLVIRLTDAVGNTVETQGTAAPGGGPLLVGPLDLTGLQDGLLTIDVVADAGGQPLGTSSFGPVVKDTLAPQPAASLDLEDPNFAPLNDINSNNVTNVVGRVSSGGVPFDAGLLIRTCFSDGTTEICTPDAMTNGTGSEMRLPPVNLVPLADGTIMVRVEIEDPAGNTMSTDFPTVQKDTWATTPTALFVPLTPQAPADIVNVATVGGVGLQIDFAPEATSDEIVTVSITDGTTTINLPPFNAPVGGGSINVGPLDLSGLLDGPLVLTAVVVDGRGNQVGFNGNPLVKDTVGPDQPTSARVAATASNPVDFVNAAVASASFIELVLPATAVGDETGLVRLIDTANQTASTVNFSAIAGGGMVALGPIDLSALLDGPLVVEVELRDPSFNFVIFAGTSATKDVSAPMPAVSAAVAAGASNAANVINSINVASTAVDVSLPASSLTTDQVRVRLTDATNSVWSASQPGTAGAATLSFAGIDVTALMDGMIPVDVEITDAAGNITLSAGTTATKDTVAPSSFAAALVAAGPSNPSHGINPNNAAQVVVDVVLGTNSLTTDTVVVCLGDGASTAMSSALAGSNGSGTVRLVGIDATSLNDGSISVQAEIRDASGNSAFFAGSAATKDTTAPAAIISARVPAGANNVMDIVNSTTAPGINVSVNLPATYAGNELIKIIISDGANPLVISAPLTAPVNGGTLVFSGINVSALNDGSLGLIVEASDPAGNVAKYPGTAATKDTLAPANPTAAGVAAGTNNAADRVNVFNVSATTIDLMLPASLVGNEDLRVFVTDSMNLIQGFGPVTAPVGGGPFQVGPIDLTMLVDGPLSLIISTMDPAGNTASFNGTPAIKAATAPTPPTAASVAVGAMNAQHFINNSNVLAAQVDVSFGSSSVPTNQVTARLSDGTTTVTSPTMAAPAGMGMISFSNLDLSSLADGMVTISIETVDQSGNPTVFAGTSATKDTAAPANPMSAGIAAGAGNAINIVNISSVSMASVTIAIPASHDGTESVSVTIGDGAISVTSSTVSSLNGGGTLTVNGIDVTSLADGALAVVVNTTDVAQNTNNFLGTAGTKDTVAPAAPSVLAVAAGGGNSANLINVSNVTTVALDITWDASNQGNETTNVVFGDGALTVAAAGPTPPNGGGAVTAGAFDVSALADGPITLSLTIIDPAGNPSPFTGTMAVKDT
ncbi:MAG: hypothetical protein KDB53_05950, partial [Planctomycetes bacterium]|nr:hypothetical protein [Planctomycetota bacterium]